MERHITDLIKKVFIIALTCYFYQFSSLFIIVVTYLDVDECCGCISLQSLEDVTGIEFRMFMDFLKSLSLFGEKAPPERMKELIGIIEGQADLDAQFNVLPFFFLIISVKHTNMVILYIKRVCFIFI